MVEIKSSLTSMEISKKNFKNVNIKPIDSMSWHLFQKPEFVQIVCIHKSDY